MENQTGIISFRLPAHIQIANSAPNFWDLIHEHGAEVDRLSGYDHEMVTALTDWLATESRVRGYNQVLLPIPRTHSYWGCSISTP